ncbi:MAG: ABC transporter ATP-binding protein [Clostridia bacterium]|nr:ABC transporter ATP-binding protein [Clostridia bacterium]
MSSKRKEYNYFNNLKFMLREHWSFDKSYVLLQIGLTPLGALTSVVAAYLPKIVLDCVESRSEISDLLIKVGVMSAVLIVFSYLQGVLQNKSWTGRMLARDILLHRLICNKVMSMDYNNYTYNETRVLREKAWNAIHGWDGSVARFIELNCTAASSFFGFSAFTAIIVDCNPWFIPILILCYGISMLGWMIFQKWKDKMKDKVAEIFLRLHYVTYRSKDFSNAKDVRIYNMSDFLMKKIDKHLDDANGWNILRNNGHYFNCMLEDVFKFGVSIAAYIYLIHLKLNSDMTLGDFSLYFGAITGFGQWLARLVDSISEIISGAHNVSDFRSFLDIEDKMNKGKGEKLPCGNELPCAIELKNLTFSYDEAEKPSVDNLSLKINKGERIAVVGVNGAGKSTLVKLICGLFIPQDGQVLINGVDSRLFNRDEYYELFSTLFQDCSLLPATVAKNIALCEENKIDRDRLRECMRLAGILDKVESLPQKENTLLVREVHEGAVAFSGGELQRLLLARALYKDAPIIILDEPTAALDPIAENDMYLKYSELTKDKTAIYISHRLSSTRFCDRIILLDDAKIAETGTHEELLALGGKYAEMFETQSKYYREEAVV